MVCIKSILKFLFQEKLFIFRVYKGELSTLVDYKTGETL